VGVARDKLFCCFDPTVKIGQTVVLVIVVADCGHRAGISAGGIRLGRVSALFLFFKVTETVIIRIPNVYSGPAD